MQILVLRLHVPKLDCNMEAHVYNSRSQNKFLIWSNEASNIQDINHIVWFKKKTSSYLLHKSHIPKQTE
jgi:hypothetical protein